MQILNCLISDKDIALNSNKRDSNKIVLNKFLNVIKKKIFLKDTEKYSSLDIHTQNIIHIYKYYNK